MILLDIDKIMGIYRVVLSYKIKKEYLIILLDIWMELSQPPLIRIYQSCQVLMTIKRKLFKSLRIQLLPHSPFNQQKRTISSKVYMYLKKIAKQIRNQLAEFSSGSDNQSHIEVVNKVVVNLKNDNQFVSQQEKMILEANKIIQNWNELEDPLMYYQQNQREALKEELKAKLKQINNISMVCKEAKKPLYVRKVERELKDNLCIITENERRYNSLQYNLALNLKKKITKLLLKLLESLESKEKSGFVEVQKNLLVSLYIDVFHGVESKVGQKQIGNYKKDFTKSLKSIEDYFKDEILCFEGLLTYLSNVESIIKQFHKQVLDQEDNITNYILDISPDINHIVYFEDALEITDSSQGWFFSQAEWSELTSKIPELKPILTECAASIEQYSKSILKRSVGSKNQSIAHFIEDKKFLEMLTKKQQTFENALFEILLSFLQKVFKNRSLMDFKYLQREEVKQFKFEKALSTIFEKYFKEIEKKGENSDRKSELSQGNKLSLNQQKQVKKIQEFINTLQIFNEEIDWKQNLTCSLGPRLLIHGKMKILPSGILYVSSFNKKNVFFGKTKLFLPRQQIYQLNKQSALGIFPDVIEVITKKGGVYFHALGKRQIMMEILNKQFFPEQNSAEGNTQETVFNEFKGSQDSLLSRIQPYLQNLQYLVAEGQIPNTNVRSYFHKYQSQEEFHYHGKRYEEFKMFGIQLAGGTNIQGAKFSPGVPYYMQVKRDSGSEIKEDIQYSERFFTYKKEVPMIPFVSKGGHGICQEKTIYRWGGPKCFVVDIFTTLSGFSLTEGMTVKVRHIFEDKKEGMHYTSSGDVTFETSSALNNMLRAPALSNLKGYLQNLFQIIKKLQKTRKVKKGSKKMIEESESNFQERIAELEQENVKLKKIIYRAMAIARL